MRWRNISVGTFLSILLLLPLYGLSPRRNPHFPVSPETGTQNVADTPTDSLTILVSWNTKSALEPCDCPFNPTGGLSRRASIIRYQMGRNPNLLLLDLGRIVDRKDISSRLRICENLKILEYLGYEAVGVCLFDLRFGRTFWEEIHCSSPLPFLCANLLTRQTGQSSAEPFIIRKVGRLKIGVVGITGLSGFIPAEVDSTINADWILLDPFQAAKEVISAIQKRVDIVILLSDLSGSANKNLIESIADIDILISSATSDVFRDIWGDDVEKRFGPPQFEIRIGETYLFNCSVLGRGGEKLGKVVLEFNNPKIFHSHSELIEMNENAGSDEIVNAMLSEFHRKLNMQKNTGFDTLDTEDVSAYGEF